MYDYTTVDPLYQFYHVLGCQLRHCIFLLSATTGGFGFDISAIRVEDDLCMVGNLEAARV